VREKDREREREIETKNELEGAASVVFACVGENRKNPNFHVLSISQCGSGFNLGLIKNLGLDPCVKYLSLSLSLSLSLIYIIIFYSKSIIFLNYIYCNTLHFINIKFKQFIK
jgi:hypothetical protein